MSNGFPGFPFGFPAQGFAGRGDENSLVNGKTFLSAGMMDSGFMAGGNIDFIKMAALVRPPPPQGIIDSLFYILSKTTS